jgi:hypothetical protein
MKLGTLFLINSIIAVLFGLLFVLIPAVGLSWYGIQLSVAGNFIARLMGAAFLGFGVISWLVRNSAGSDEARSIALGFFVADIIGFLFSLIYQLQGVANGLGWTTVALYLLLSLGFGYFYWMRPSTT